MRKILAIAATLLATQTAVWAHGAEELGHHWEIPAYRIEMLKQINIMTGIIVAVVMRFWIKGLIRGRRAGQ